MLRIARASLQNFVLSSLELLCKFEQNKISNSISLASWDVFISFDICLPACLPPYSYEGYMIDTSIARIILCSLARNSKLD